MNFNITIDQDYPQGLIGITIVGVEDDGNLYYDSKIFPFDDSDDYKVNEKDNVRCLKMEK